MSTAPTVRAQVSDNVKPRPGSRKFTGSRPTGLRPVLPAKRAATSSAVRFKIPRASRVPNQRAVSVLSSGHRPPGPGTGPHRGVEIHRRPRQRQEKGGQRLLTGVPVGRRRAALDPAAESGESGPIHPHLPAPWVRGPPRGRPGVHRVGLPHSCFEVTFYNSNGWRQSVGKNRPCERYLIAHRHGGHR
jgi:hypothetical protein